MILKQVLSLLRSLSTTISAVLGEILPFGRVVLRSHASLIAESLFLRKQLAFYRKRQVKPRRLNDAARLSLIWPRWFDWKDALVVVKAETLIGWHSRAFQLFWRWKSRGGRPNCQGIYRH